MRRAILIAILLWAAAITSAAQTIAITNGTVYPVNSAPIQNATVLIRDGVIVAVGPRVNIPADARRIDATGKVVTPGLINSLTQLGVIEIDQVRETNDNSAKGTNNISAAFRVWEGLNAASMLFAPARNEGITTAIITPQGGLISGQAAVIDLLSGDAADMIRRAPVAMVAQIGNPNDAGTGARGELLGKLRILLEDVRFYAQHRADYDRAAARSLSAPKADLEALIPVLDGKLPLLLEANRVDEIEAALALARDYDLKLMIVGGAEAWLAADRLAAAQVPVLTGAMSNIPGSFATLNQRQENAGLLRRAGVRVAITATGGSDVTRFNARNLKYEAGNAVAYGMSHDDALRAVTLTPAELFGVSDRIGSLQAGREANVVVWSGDPFEFSTQAEHVFIHGREVQEPSRQDMLIERYKPKSK
ncbi:MAG: amidohydrolase family protein [Acidobacteriota bacterium]